MTLLGQSELAYRYMVNDTFTVQQKAIQHITQDLNGVDQIIENNLQSTMHFKVVDRESQIITLEMTFKRMKMTMSSPNLGEMLNLDTAASDNTMQAKMFKGAIDVPIVLKMERTGKIQSVSGGDKIIASMFKSAGITDQETMELTAPQFEKQFGSQALSNSFEQMSYFLPDRSVSVNESWSNTYTGDLKAENQWILKSKDNESVIINGKAIVTMSSVDDNVVMVLHGEQTATIELNPSNTLFKTITVKGSYFGDTKIKASNMIIQTTITSTITYKTL